MDVILLERIAKLGQMGEVVRVRDGFARNYLLPQQKALRATEANRKRFERDRADLEARNLERRTAAGDVAEVLNGQVLTLIRQAGETGHLYGSVATRDVAEALSQQGFAVNRNQVALNAPLKTIGVHTVEIALHPEVSATITVNIARSPDEAERQLRGEDLTQRGQDFVLEVEEEEEGEEEA